MNGTIYSLFNYQVFVSSKVSWNSNSKLRRCMVLLHSIVCYINIVSLSSIIISINYCIVSIFFFNLKHTFIEILLLLQTKRPPAPSLPGQRHYTSSKSRTSSGSTWRAMQRPPTSWQQVYCCSCKTKSMFGNLLSFPQNVTTGNCQGTWVLW